jgi:hypothetical protein
MRVVRWLVTVTMTVAALAADLGLAPTGDQTTALALAGANRPQPGPADTGLERAVVRRCADAAIRSFLARVACTLVPTSVASVAMGELDPPTSFFQGVLSHIADCQRLSTASSVGNEGC